MLKYIGQDGGVLKAFPDAPQVTTGSAQTYERSDNKVMSQILVAKTDVIHSGTYQCEPGAAPAAIVNVHVLDGK